MSPRGSRSINYSASPLLASKTPVWRSKFIVAALALAFVGLGARAAYVQVFGNDFFQRQGEVRFARTLELPANRGRVLDRNGLILATSVVAQSVWAIPEDVDKADPKHHQAINDVKEALIAHLKAVASSGVRQVSKSFQESLPALVVAYKQFADATRVTQVTQSNAMNHPGFSPNDVKVSRE